MGTFLRSLGPSAPKAKDTARFPHRAALCPNTHSKTPLWVPFEERRGPAHHSCDLAALTDAPEVDERWLLYLARSKKLIYILRRELISEDLTKKAMYSAGGKTNFLTPPETLHLVCESVAQICSLLLSIKQLLPTGKKKKKRGSHCQSTIKGLKSYHLGSLKWLFLFSQPVQSWELVFTDIFVKRNGYTKGNITHIPSLSLPAQVNRCPGKAISSREASHTVQRP